MAEHDGHIELERSIDSIVVGVRHRQYPGEGVESLMESIKRLGLLQPVTITPDGVLVCGARRLEAVKRLGWPT
jgi:ParB family chromosome partitioning protein